MEQVGRPVAVLLVAYILYYAVMGSPAQFARAIKIVYYVFNVVDNVYLQHH
jgi:hypothetical protein